MKITAIYRDQPGKRALAYDAPDGTVVGDELLVPRPWFLHGVDNEYGSLTVVVTALGGDWDGALVKATKP